MRFQTIKKNLMLTVLASLLFSSCASDGQYRAGVAAVSGSAGVSGSLSQTLPQKQWWHGRIVKYVDIALVKRLRVSEFWHHEMIGHV